MISDADLVQHAIRGSPDAWAALVKKYRPRVVMWASQKVPSQQDAQDIAQEALLQAYTKLATLQQNYKPKVLKGKQINSYN